MIRSALQIVFVTSVVSALLAGCGCPNGQVNESLAGCVQPCQNGDPPYCEGLTPFRCQEDAINTDWYYQKGTTCPNSCDDSAGLLLCK